MTHIHLLPREKLEQRGVESLSDTDLVSVLLGSGIKGKDVFAVASSVARMIAQTLNETEKPQENADNIPSLTWKDFHKIRGVGKVKAMQLACAIECGRRWHGVRDEGRSVIRGRSDVVAMCSYLKKRKQEHVVVLGLNARNEVVGKRTVAIGSLNKAVVEPREILGWALSTGVSGVILVHNHPSGSTDQSKADVIFTERVKKAADLLGIEFIDHVIV